ncbi:stage II sporulation protein M [Geoglobus acetivorans]|uniref:stage II sporulation protein M n=1 Tax=Geoglobus acetivorans TaxID=565033 RepID=UPI00064E943B
MLYEIIALFFANNRFFMGFIVGLKNYNTVDLPKSRIIIIPEFDNFTHESLSFGLILTNNVKVVLVCIFGSLFLSVPTLLTLFRNGFILGYQTASSLSTIGFQTFAYVFPHGIFEIPAIIIAGAAGFKIPYEIIRYLAGKKEQIPTRGEIKEYLTLALISIILVVITAWIEANITLKIARSMLNSTKGI